MEKITDERLVIRNLKNIRIAFGIENLTILVIMIYEFIKGYRFEEVFSYNNPLFLVLMVGCFSVIVLSVNVSAPMEDKSKWKQRKLLLITGIVFLVATVFFYVAMQFYSLLLALGCGAIVALVEYLIFWYANKYRD